MSYTIRIVEDPIDTTFNQLLAINDEGQIAGYYGDGLSGHPNQGYVAELTKDGYAFTPEDFPTSVQTQVTGINNAGTTVGFEVDAAGDSFGFIDNEGVYSIAIDPSVPTIGGVVTEQFLGVNDHGEVAGFYQKDAAGDAAAFTYSAGAFTAINVAGASSVVATDVNDAGVVSGFFTEKGVTEGFYDVNGVIHDLSHSNWSNIQALGLNDAGLIVGSYQNPHGDTFGFVYNVLTGVYTPIGVFASTETVINGVNDKGQLVGFYLDSSGHTDGLLMTPSTMSTSYTATTIDNQGDPTFNQLLSINNQGQIAGYFGAGGSASPNRGYIVNDDSKFVAENYPGSAQTQVTGINNRGQTVGFEVDAAGDSVGFLHGSGSWQLLLDPRAPKVNGVVTEQILGVNDRNEAVGFYINDAADDAVSFVYNQQTGAFTKLALAAPGGGAVTSVTATDINDEGEISGFYTVNGVSQGFIDNGGHVTDIAGATGDTNVQVLGINNTGLAVGSFQHGGVTEGFMYSLSSGSFTAYDAPKSSGETVLNGVNDVGQIVGFYADAAGATHGLLLNPIV